MCRQYSHSNNDVNLERQKKIKKIPFKKPLIKSGFPILIFISVAAYYYDVIKLKSLTSIKKILERLGVSRNQR